MSRHRGGRDRKYWNGGDATDLPPVAVARRPVTVAQQPARVAPSVSAIEARILAVIPRFRGATVWADDPLTGGVTTTEIRQALEIHGRGADAELNASLTAMRRRGLLHYELDTQPDRVLRWWLTPRGGEAARSAT